MILPREKNIYTCAGTVAKWQKEKEYTSQMQTTSPGKDTCRDATINSLTMKSDFFETFATQ